MTAKLAGTPTAPILTGLVVLCLASAAPTAQFAHGERQGDVQYYERRALEMRDGQLPYHDFYFEYPPGSLAVILPPAFAPSSYGLAFRIEQWLLCAAVLILTCLSLSRLGAGRRRVLAAAILVGLTPLALGSVLFNRFDLWPAALVALSMTLLVTDRRKLGMAAFGVATVTKIYPAAGALVAAAWLVRRYGRRSVLGPAVAYTVAAVAILLPFAVVGFGGLGFSLYTQLSRGLEVESLGGSLLVAADRAGLHDATVVPALSFDVGGTLAEVLAVAQGLLLVAAVAAIVVVVSRHPNPDLEVLTTGVAAAVTAVAVFGKVLSPQYMIWLVPLVPLAARAIWVPACAALGSALVLTNLWYPEHFDEIVTMSGSRVWLVPGRNLVLLALLTLLLGWLVASRSRALAYERDQIEKPSTAAGRYPRASSPARARTSAGDPA